jgi:hypothetical protein
MGISGSADSNDGAVDIGLFDLHIKGPNMDSKFPARFA